MMKSLLIAGSAVAALAAMPAQAANFSFAGNLSNANQVLFFDFSVGASSSVTLRSYSYAGGTNAAGAVIARGGFDPILSLYDVATGNRIGQDDDGSCSQVGMDSVSHVCYDVYFSQTLGTGNYRVAVSVYNNFGPATLSGTFPGTSHTDYSDVSGAANNPRDSHFAFDVLNVAQATGPGGGAVPEPASWAMMIAGFGLVGGAMRRRATKVAFAM